MSLSYNSFIELLNNYNVEGYLNPIVIDNINLFLERTDIEIEDITIKSNNMISKNNLLKKKRNFNQKNRQYKDDKNELIYLEKNNLTFSNSVFDVIKYDIRNNLNKVTHDNYEQVLEELINNIIKHLENNNHNEIFTILTDEIIQKSIIDDKYQNIYIDLINNINNNKNINKKNEFLRNVIDKLQLLVNNPELYNIFNDDELVMNKNKKYIYGLYNFISRLYIKNIINNKILSLIFIKLLHCDNNFDEMTDIEIELCYIINKNIFESISSLTNKQNIIQYYNEKIFIEFIELFKQLLNNDSISNNKRNIFLLNENIRYINEIKNYKITTIKRNNIVNDINNIKKNIQEYYKNNEYNKIYDKIITNINNKNDYNVVIKYLIDKILNEKDVYNKEILIEKIYNHDKKIFISELEYNINNIDDIILDVPYICNNLLDIIDILKDNLGDENIINYIDIIENKKKEIDEMYNETEYI